jgi:hypothetical protein
VTECSIIYKPLDTPKCASYSFRAKNVGLLEFRIFFFIFLIIIYYHFYFILFL